MRARELAQNWRKAPADAAVESVLRAAGSAPTQGGGVG